MTLSTNPKKAIEDIAALIALDLPVIMKGQPGVGKSDVGREVTRKWLGVDELTTHGAGRNFIDFRATLIDPVDLHGLPIADKEKNVARWLPMGLLPGAEDASEGVLFIDEITNADQSVKGALYGLVLDRFVGEYHLPKGWRIIAAGNRVEDRASAGRMPSALSNRFVHLTLEPTVDDWIEWAMGSDVPPVMVAFMRFRPLLLNDFDPAREINATPRSWAMVAKIIAKGLPQDIENRLILGAVGEGPGAEFMAFVKIWRELPNPDVVLMDPMGAEVPENSAAQWAISGALANRVGENTLEAMVQYTDRMPKEFAITAMRDATSRAPELAATKTFIQWAQENQDLYL
jgi:hypothetical protein